MTPGVSEARNKTSRATGSGEPPLSLADSNADSTHMTNAISARRAPGDSNGAPSAKQPHQPQAALSAGDSATEGASTGGFETMLGKLVVERGLASNDEVEQCTGRIKEAGNDDPRMLGDLLVNGGFVTERQLARLREEFEDNRSTQSLPGYKIRRKLGAGAMATVFLAKQISLDRHVAIKVLPQKFSANGKFIERFYKEGRAAAKLNHPNIVSAYDVGKAGDHHYFVMEYVDGPTLYDRIVKEKRLPEKDAIEIVRQVALALQHAHERGFVHRDIKPKNIMMTTQGVVKLADLGLARAVSDKEAAQAEAGRAYGTPYYISPEQVRGEVTIGPQADIYGLGATFYHMVTGKVPFEGKNPTDVMHRHLKSELVPPDHVNTQLSGGTAQVIEMMMSKNARDRYQNCGDLLEDLDRISKGEPPLFAHKQLDMSSVTAGLVTSSATAEVARHEPERSGLMESPAALIFAILLVGSVIANAVLVLLMMSR